MDPKPEAPPPLSGRLVRLRAMEETDADTLNPLFCDPDVLRSLSMSFPQPLAGFRDFWRSQREDPSSMNFVVEALDTRQAIGACGLSGLGLSGAPELGVWIGKPFWNLGYGTDTMRTLCRYGFRELALHRVTLHVFSTNPGAIRTYEKVGFRIEGTMRQDMFQDGRWVDTHVMGLLDSEFAG